MFLITKSGKRKAICRECARLHGAKDCPKRPSVLRAQRKQEIAELKSAASSLLPALEQAAGARRLDEIAPARVRLPNGRHTKVNYEAAKPPWIASRLQDFFGMRETPRIANGKVALVVHLLAPNRRPVQTTTDLAGFWQRLYPQVRRELSRRYPKHAWPEDPYSARSGHA